MFLPTIYKKFIGDKAITDDYANTDERVMWALVKLYLQMFSGLLLHRLGGFCS